MNVIDPIQPGRNRARLLTAFPPQPLGVSTLRPGGIFAVALCLLIVGCRGEVPVPAQSTAGKPVPVVPAQSPAEANATSQVPPEVPFVLESDFQILSLDAFDAFAADQATWQATDEGIACSGKPRGYLYSKQAYQNFTWRFEYRFVRPDKLKDDSKFKGNTGFLVYITGEHKLWPICLEVQGKYSQMAAIKENGGAQPVTVQDNEDARQRARTKVGDWHTLDIVSKGGELQVTLNGTLIATSQPDFLSEGLIGIQSEDHPFEIRRMRIRVD